MRASPRMNAAAAATAAEAVSKRAAQVERIPADAPGVLDTSTAAHFSGVYAPRGAADPSAYRTKLRAADIASVAGDADAA